MSKILAAALAAMMFPAPVPVFGQALNDGTAVEEAVRRQEAAKLLKIKLAEAKAAERKGQILDASRLYQEGVVQLGKLGAQTAGIEAERAELLKGFSAVCLTLSKAEEKRGNFQASRDQVNRALAVDPKNPALLEQKRQIDQLLEASKGRVPSNETLARAPKIAEEKIELSTAVQDAKWLLEAGKLDEAEAILVKALQTDPSSSAANHYLTLLKQARYEQASRKRDQMSQKSIIEIEDTWTPRKKAEDLPSPNPMARTNLVYTSEGRQKILQKLDKIRLDEVSYDGLPLATVLTALREESAKRDPDREGVNFLLRSQPDAVVLPPPVPLGGSGSGAPSAPPPSFAGDPSANAPLAAVDVNSISIRITPALRKLTLKQALDAIVQVSDQPITYRIDDYAVVFQPKPPAAQQLITRQFRVDPNTFVQGLQGVFGVSLTTLAGSQANGGGGQGGGGGGGGGGGNNQDSISFIIPSITPSGIISSGGGGGGGGGIGGGGGGFGGGGRGGGGFGGGQGGQNANNPGVSQNPISYVTAQLSTRDMNDMARLYFEAAGVDLQPPKSIFFNDRAGILVVRAAAQDLETIQTAIEVLNSAPPQITIEAKFAEFNQTDNKQLGFDWYLGNTLAAGGDIGVQGGTAPTFNGQPSTANPLGAFPTPNNPIPSSATDGLLTQGLRSSAPSVFTLSGILTDPQFRAVIKALEQREGADVLTAPKVTTLSGRQAKIAINDLVTYVSGLQTQGGGGGGAVVAGGATTTGGQNQQIVPTTATFPVGPTLDVVPYVSADGFSVQMTIIPTVNEFLGYDTSNFNAILQLGVGNTVGNALVAPTPLPRFRVRYVTTSCVVWDGQTVVLGGLISDSIQKIKDKVPVLGDLPLFGRFFRSESNTTSKKNLYIFVTPTIIDPAGNRVHSDEDLPFARQNVVDPARSNR